MKQRIFLGLILLTAFLSSWELAANAGEMAPTTQQTWTLRALISELEENHFADKRYNDAMSASHLETYLGRS